VKLDFVPKNGMKVIAAGRVGVYSKTGAYQLYVSSMRQEGKGNSAMALEMLKRKLEAEGLFDGARKRPIPKFPKSIGVITSVKGAALQDILNVSARRWSSAEIVICPASVQGENAPGELRAAMKYFNTYGGVDVVIIGRGGGSGEDLSAFNDEGLARLVAASPVPVISAVGHQTDFTICDFTADKRAPTPSAAAELATPDKEEILDFVCHCESFIKGEMQKKLKLFRQQLTVYEKSAEMSSSSNFINLKKTEIEGFEQQLKSGVQKRLSSCSAALEGYSSSLLGLNPLFVLSRGYAYVTDSTGKNVSSAEDTDIGNELNIRFSKSLLTARVVDKKNV
jgi:exodeoxyribonuclease VII large subunit